MGINEISSEQTNPLNSDHKIDTENNKENIINFEESVNSLNTTEKTKNDYFIIEETESKETVEKGVTDLEELIKASKDSSEFRIFIGSKLGAAGFHTKSKVGLIKSYITSPQGKDILKYLALLILGLKLGSQTAFLSDATLNRMAIKKAKELLDIHKGDMTEDQIKDVNDQIAKLEKNLTSKAIVASLKIARYSHSVTAIILNILKISNPVIDTLGWVFPFVKAGLGLYKTTQNMEKLQKQEELLKKTKEKLKPDKFNITSVEKKFDEFYKSLKNNENLDLKNLVNLLRENGINRIDIGEKDGKKQFVSLTNKSLTTERLLNLINKFYPTVKEAYDKYHLEEGGTIKNTVEEKKVLREQRKNMETWLEERKKTFENKIKETKNEFNEFIHSLDHIEPSSTEFVKLFESEDLSLEDMVGLLRKNGIYQIDVPSKNKEEKQRFISLENPDLTEERLRQYVVKKFSKGIKEAYDNYHILEALEKKGIHMETIDPSVSMNKTSEIEGMPEVKFDENPVLKSSLTKQELLESIKKNKDKMHEAYVKHRETIDTSLKTILKATVVKKAEVDHKFREFTFYKDLLEFAIPTIAVAAIASLTLLAAAGIIVCPPLLIPIITTHLSISLSSVTVVGVFLFIYHRPNLFKTYLNGDYINQICASLKKSIMELYYNQTIDQKALEILAKGHPMVNAEKIATYEKLVYLKSLDDRLKECNKKINETSWKDLFKTHPGNPLEIVMEHLLPEDKLDTPFDKDLVKFLKDHMKIDLNEIKFDDNNKTIADAIVEKLKVDIESFAEVIE